MTIREKIEDVLIDRLDAITDSDVAGADISDLASAIDAAIESHLVDYNVRSEGEALVADLLAAWDC